MVSEGFVICLSFFPWLSTQRRTPGHRGGLPRTGDTVPATHSLGATRAGEYKLTDDTYAALLDGLARRHFDSVTPDLRSNILAFYSDLNAPIATKKNRKKWARTLEQLQQLKNIQVVAARPPAPAD